MVTYHPSYLLRPYNQSAKREAWEDLKKVLHYRLRLSAACLYRSKESTEAANKKTEDDDCDRCA